MAKLVKCKSCGAEIAKSAKVCPSCGAKRKHTVLGVILLILGISLIAAALGGGKDEPKKLDNTDVNSQISEQTENQGTDSQEPKQEKFFLGDTVQLNGINVKLIDVHESAGSQFMKPTDGNVFVTFELEFDNQSKKEIAVSSLMMFTAYFDDYSTNISIEAITDSGKTQLDGYIAAGKKMSGVVGYEAPADWKVSEIHITPDFWAGDDIIFEYSK